MNQDEMLAIMKESGALLDGHFELRSKLHSNRYFQCANVLRYPRLAGRLCDELVARMRKRVPGVPRRSVRAKTGTLGPEVRSRRSEVRGVDR